MPYSLVRALEAAAYRTKNRLVNLFDPPVVVLLYHRVTTLSTDPQLLAVSPENFLAHLRFLKNNFTLTGFEEDWDRVKKPALAITFDDGYADNVREALPILEDVGVPATFFVSTGLIGTQKLFWWDELEHLFFKGDNFPERFVLTDNSFERVWPTATAVERQVLFEEILPLLRETEPQRREDWLEQLRRWAQLREAAVAEIHRLLTEEELRQLAGSRWATIGAHTVTHSRLSCLGREEQQQEIVGSKTHLESMLGKEVSVFSYPFGTKDDYTDESVDLCREAGFVKAAATFPAQAHRWTDQYQIPRQVVRNWPVEIFAEKLKGFWLS